MKASLFYLPSIGSRAEIEAGMAGMNPHFYQRMLGELSEQIKLGDELGYDSVSFTEHHFHIEGFELSNNPVLLDLYFAMQTKRIRVGQLGIVLPASNPIRVAEDIAMLDHMTGGRANAGFARGYQRRGVDVMAQQTHGIPGAARRTGERGLRARLPASLGRRHGAADAWHPRRAAQPARCDRPRESAGLRGEFPYYQAVLDRGDAELTRHALGDARAAH